MRKLSIIIPILLLASCSVTETISLSSENSGESMSEINVEQFFVDVLYDFAEFLPDNNQSIMDDAISSFEEALESLPSVQSAESSKTGENQYVLSFSYDDITAMMEDLGVENQSLVKTSGNSFSFYLDINNYGELKQVVPFLADPNFEVYGPEYNQGMSEADYLEMITFLLGEEGPDAISNGMISIYINVPGEIEAADGAEIADMDTALVSFPLIRFLLLDEPISFSVSWK